MKEDVQKIIENSLVSLQGRWGLDAIPEVEIEIPRDESMGDFATTVAMRLAKPLKAPPRKIAEEIVAEIEDLITHAPPIEKGGRWGFDIFENIEIAGPGYINFKLKNSYFYNSLYQLLEEEHSSLRSDIGKGRRVQVEYVSANPTGPLHIGHGRGAAVGSALCNILRAAGYSIQSEFYINDAGLQVKLLGRSVYARYQQASGNDVPFPEDGYQGDYIESIARDIREEEGEKYLNRTFEDCGEFFTDYSYKMMLANLETDLKDFGVIFDTWQSEKELHAKGMVQDALNTLKDKGLLYEKEGATWFSSSEFGDDKDRVIRKQDGEFTYFASDICYHKNKLDRGFDTIIDIWGADHHGYIPRVRSVLEAFGLPREKFEVILIQMVSLLRHGEPVPMSKRSGQFVTLREVIDEVGTDVAKFIFLTRRADSHLDFDIEVAKEQSSENPVFYVQYAFARISSLFRQAAEKHVLDADVEDQSAQRNVLKEKIRQVDFSLLLEDEDFLLMKKILLYPMVFEGAALSYEVNRITFYLQELASVFHSYYNKHRILTEDSNLSLARLSMCRAVQVVLEEGLKLLGVSAPERM
ncbi:MAG: arginine--tRNA ligase [Nitrospiraceae bacterium]|nr:MAG: arginine--tRNA ligase [Nitrospiraceae bacterium]